MLVMSRRIGERFKIGEDCWVTILAINHGKAKVGVEAPREVRVVREERLPVVKDCTGTPIDNV